AGRLRDCSGRSWLCPSPPLSATWSVTCSADCPRTSPKRSRSRCRMWAWVRTMPDGIDPYKVLQVDPEAEDEVIQAAYRRLARKYHPDVAGADGAARMASINVAWELLRDPGRRALHDRERRGAAAGPT